MSNQPNILKMLDLSTKHLPEELGQDLGGVEGVIAHEFTYGWLLWVPTVDPGAREAVEREEILRIFDYAERHDCTYVLFDRGAGTVDDLPTWNW